MRQLVTVRTVSELIPIEGADKIELAKVDGWQCVVKKGDFKVGDVGIYFEIDSVLPADDERFAFLAQRKFRVKTMRLRGVLSQGLLMPVTILSEEEKERFFANYLKVESGRGEVEFSLYENATETLTDILRVQKYEPPLPISGEQKRPFPTHLIPKTDQERIQNIPEVLHNTVFAGFEITEKLDGTSCTFYHYDGKSILNQGVRTSLVMMGACSRNWEMKLDDQNVYAKLWDELMLKQKFLELGRNIAVQGEIVGPGIQNNIYKRAKQEFYVFDIFDIDTQQYLGFWERWQLVSELGLFHVPVLQREIIDRAGGGDIGSLSDITPTLEVVLDLADGESALYPTPREGVVFKSNDGDLSFKAISNKFLLGE